MNLYLTKDKRTFDAIVIGSGMAGGWAAKELCEKGLRTLVLERGREVRHIVDYPTATNDPWDFEHHGQRLPLSIKAENPIIGKCYAFKEETQHFFVKDAEHKYVQDKPFDWIRGYQTGGKSLMWARQVQRWSDFDFEGPARDGFAVDWPIRATATVFRTCPTANFNRRCNSTQPKNICNRASRRITPTAK